MIDLLPRIAGRFGLLAGALALASVAQHAMRFAGMPL